MLKIIEQKIIIALTGRSSSGKTTAAKFLEEFVGFERLSFAQPLKRMAMECFGICPIALAEKGGVVRKTLQGLGSAIREVDTEYFVSQLLERIIDSESDLLVIDDLRFENEAEFIKRCGGYIVKIYCPNSPRNLTGATSQHASETGTEDLDHDSFISANYGDIEKINTDILEIARQHMKAKGKLTEMDA